MQYLIESIDDSNKSEMLNFLKRYDDYTLFLLGNSENYGFRLTKEPYSGNFKLVRFGDQIVGVFCLTKKGSLLIESTVKEPIFDIVLASCLEESIPLTGVVGSWDFCSAFWQFLKDKKVIHKETFFSKEILYGIELSNISSVT